MKTFLHWLEEGLHIQNDVHHNISVTTLKRIAKNAPMHRNTSAARFVIDQDDKLHGANAHKFMHHQIEPDWEKVKITGAIGYNHTTGGYTHEIYDDRRSHFNQRHLTPEHPHITAMKAAAIFANPKGKYIL